MGEIQFRIAAKTDVGRERTNNEDNFQAAADLGSGRMQWTNNAIRTLGDKGALLVVADGMGGMNAGEVASEIAISTVCDRFAPEAITDAITRNRFAIEKFMNDTVVEADRRIKEHAKADVSSRGMGTTIVIGWLIGGKLYVSWCGDSRAYIYNPRTGLHQISKDHSYVQSLVDNGSLTREEAFDFPESNIITRSLCDAGPKARPEALLQPYDLADGDIVMLCTDGLSGMLHDNEMEEIIAADQGDMAQLADSLIHGACEASGSDNITLCLAQIVSGGVRRDPHAFDAQEKRLNGKAAAHDAAEPAGMAMPEDGATGEFRAAKAKAKAKSRRLTAIGIASALCVVAAICLALWLWPGQEGKQKEPQKSEKTGGGRRDKARQQAQGHRAGTEAADEAGGDPTGGQLDAAFDEADKSPQRPAKVKVKPAADTRPDATPTPAAGSATGDKPQPNEITVGGYRLQVQPEADTRPAEKPVRKPDTKVEPQKPQEAPAAQGEKKKTRKKKTRGEKTREEKTMGEKTTPAIPTK